MGIGAAHAGLSVEGSQTCHCMVAHLSISWDRLSLPHWDRSPGLGKVALSCGWETHWVCGRAPVLPAMSGPCPMVSAPAQHTMGNAHVPRYLHFSKAKEASKAGDSGGGMPSSLRHAGWQWESPTGNSGKTMAKEGCPSPGSSWEAYMSHIPQGACPPVKSVWVSHACHARKQRHVSKHVCLVLICLCLPCLVHVVLPCPWEVGKKLLSVWGSFSGQRLLEVPVSVAAHRRVGGRWTAPGRHALMPCPVCPWKFRQEFTKHVWLLGE